MGSHSWGSCGVTSVKPWVAISVALATFVVLLVRVVIDDILGWGR